MRGQTLLKGHTLISEGFVHFNDQGVKLSRSLRLGSVRPSELHAKCSCGELSPPGISQYAAKKWHREHKQTIRDSML